MEIHSSLVVNFPDRKFPIGGSWFISPARIWIFPVETKLISHGLYRRQHIPKDYHSTSKKLRISNLGLYAFEKGESHTEWRNNSQRDSPAGPEAAFEGLAVAASSRPSGSSEALDLGEEVSLISGVILGLEGTCKTKARAAFGEIIFARSSRFRTLQVNTDAYREQRSTFIHVYMWVHIMRIW